jgi:protoporphyrinogen oxidase
VCLAGLAEAIRSNNGVPAADFEEALLNDFGKPLCDIFMFPYNRKMWKRPLSELSPSGFQWNIERPDFEKALEGVLAPNRKRDAYNSRGWYPRPPAGSRKRGMEVLSDALSKQVNDLRSNHTAKFIDLEHRTVRVGCNNGDYEIRFDDGCLATIPLPELISMCDPVPEDLLSGCRELRRNRVLMAAFSIEGTRPVDRGHWRYYADESLLFNRLIFMHEFDPLCAPDNGWGLMAEITEPAEKPLPDMGELLSRVRKDVAKTGEVGEDCRIVGEHVWVADPAYVVMTPDTRGVVENARSYLEQHGITTLGRYGCWAYSSMAQVLKQGFDWADLMEKRPLLRARPQLGLTES